MFIWLIGFIIWIVCLILNIRIAQNKNRNLVVWVILSVFFSWITLIINLILPPRESY
ncbi:MAG: hypothetical protein LIO75_07855 [Lachnospiraceae bacterium]|nr:hypothetical protein [Lachnospiraceae bacterium]